MIIINPRLQQTGILLCQLSVPMCREEHCASSSSSSATMATSSASYPYVANDVHCCSYWSCGWSVVSCCVLVLSAAVSVAVSSDSATTTHNNGSDHQLTIITTTSTVASTLHSCLDYANSLSYNTSSANINQKCGPMPNVMAALPNTGGALCSTPQFGYAVTLPRHETH